MKEFIVFLLLLIAIIAGNSYSILSFDLATFFTFILVVGLLIYRDRRKVKFDKIIFIRRTKKGRDFIDRTASRFSGFWKIFGVAGVVVAVLLLALGSFFLISQAFAIMGGAEGGVRLLLPGPVSAPTNLPGAFVVPWWIWIIGVAAVIIPHEFMHGIMCRLDKVKIKSVGWILLLIIPGAFVEPDEKQLRKSRRSTKLRVYAAGSFANFMVAMLVLVVLAASFSASFSSSGVFVSTINGTPANLSGLHGAITEINGVPVRSQEDIRNILSNYKPGDVVNVKAVGGDVIVPAFHAGLDFFAPKPVVVLNTTDVKTYSITLGATETGRAFLGVYSIFRAASFNGTDIQTYQAISTLLLWIYIFSLGIGIVNILPIKPLDGGLLFEELVGRFTKRSQFVVRFVSSVMLLILIFNLVGPILVR